MVQEEKEDGHEKAVQYHPIAGSFVQPEDRGRAYIYILLIKGISPFQLIAWPLQT